MSYNTVHRCANDHELIDRVTACCAQEGRENPVQASDALRWTVAGSSDVEAAYASALEAENPSPGSDESVVTDGMILSIVQANPEVTA